MATRTKTRMRDESVQNGAVEELETPTETLTPPEVPEAVIEYPPLEHVNEDIRSRLTVWGNSTQLTITQLERVAPGWAFCLRSMFDTVGDLMEANQ